MAEDEAVNGLNRDVADAYAAIVQSSDDAIYAKDSKAVVTAWNPAAERLYGYSAEEACGQVISFIIPEDRSGEEFDILERVMRGERVDHYETKRRRRDGQIIEVSISVSPVHDTDGNVVEAAVIARDFTERRRLEAEVEAARAAHTASRRKQALELNDEVVQGLVAAKMAFESGQAEKGLESVTATLVRAKAIVTRLLDDYKEEGSLEPGDLILDSPSDPAARGHN